MTTTEIEKVFDEKSVPFDMRHEGNLMSKEQFTLAVQSILRSQSNKPLTEKYIPYQTCPKCGGQGIMTKPPYIPGDVNEWVSSDVEFICDVCKGKKIIPMHEDEQPLTAEQAGKLFDREADVRIALYKSDKPNLISRSKFIEVMTGGSK